MWWLPALNFVLATGLTLGIGLLSGGLAFLLLVGGNAP